VLLDGEDLRGLEGGGAHQAALGGDDVCVVGCGVGVVGCGLWGWV
jgi:hypothetical protein